MTVCTTSPLLFPACKKRQVEVNFDGGDVTSDGGVLLLRGVDRNIGLTRDAAKIINDPRRQGSCVHNVQQLLQQRVYAIALGYEDGNDHETLRKDPAIQTAIDRVEDLASPATLSRFENWISPSVFFDMHELFVDKFLDSFNRRPKEIILDFDATDDRVHGEQEGRSFNAFYDSYCFLPLYVFCGSQMLVAYLRPGHVHAAHNAGAVLRLLVKKIRSRWKKVKIIFRGDSGFLKPRILRWCDQNSVDYIVGIAKNSRLEGIAKEKIIQAEKRFEKTKKKVRYFTSISYAAGTWDRERRVIVKAEHTEGGSNPRFVVTSLSGGPKCLYEDVYCARGDMENRIKEQQLHLFADRTSCSYWEANQFRLLLSSMAYILLDSLRRKHLQKTKLSRAQCDTIRLRLLKIGAVITRNTRRVRFFMSSSYPMKEIFLTVAASIHSG